MSSILEQVEGFKSDMTLRIWRNSPQLLGMFKVELLCSLCGTPNSTYAIEILFAIRPLPAYAKVLWSGDTAYKMSMKFIICFHISSSTNYLEIINIYFRTTLGVKEVLQ